MQPRDDPRGSSPAEPTHTSAPGRSPSASSSAPGREHAAPTFASGEILAGRFRITRFVAQGGMGEVYEAHDLELKEDVALKTIRRDIAAESRAVERFMTEIHLARKVTHPNACRIFDVFHHQPPGGQETLFLTMELLRGETLASRLKQAGRLSTEAALPFARQMAAALDAAHAAGIVHRDFKAANVMLVPKAQGERAVVTDFGLAHRTARDESTTTASISIADQLAGTPAYMAPEQIEGGALGAYTDVYAFGIVLYEMVTGERPYQGDSSVASLIRRLKERPPSPRRTVADLDPRWEKAILRCLERDPADRFRGAEDVIRALAGEDVSAGRGEAARQRRRRQVALAALAAAALLAISLGWRLVRGRLRSGPASPPPAAVAPAKARRSVAVLGLKNLSGRAETLWLSTALSEMLGSELAAGESVRIIPGERVARMAADLALGDGDALAAESQSRIRSYLGADLLVQGSYAVLSGRIRLDLRLQDAGGEALTSLTETGGESELFEMVSRAGSRLRQQLGAAPRSEQDAGGVRAALPAHPGAARLYAEGLDRLRQFDALAARALFERAVALEPKHPLTHAALGQALSVLGYESPARDEAKQAWDLSGSLSREDRLSVEARYREAAREWDRAIELYRSLRLFFPDNLEYGLRLADAQTSAGQGRDALQTCDALRRLAPPGGDDPRIDLNEAVAARFVSESKRAVEAARRAAGKAGPRHERHVLARARYEEGASLLKLGEADKAQAALERAQAMFLEAGDKRGTAGALNSLALLRSNQGDLVASQRISEEALALYRSLGNRAGEALVLGNLGIYRYMQGDFSGARGRWKATLVTFREINDKQGVARMLTNIAAAEGELGDAAGARKRWEEALVVWREIGHKEGILATQSNIAKALFQDGDLQRAEAAYREVIRLAREMGDKSHLALFLHDYAHVLMARDDLAGARRDLEEARALREEAKEQPGVASSRVALAEVAIHEGRPAAAEGPASESAAYYREQKNEDNEALARITLARSLLAQGRAEAAREAAERATAMTAKSENRSVRAGAVVVRARAQAALAKSPVEALAAARALRAYLAQRGKGLPLSLRFEARLALAEIAGRSESRAGAAEARALADEARKQGFLLVARQAQALAGD